MDIVPTYAMFMQADRKLASAYWHWVFPRSTGAVSGAADRSGPDYFYETCLTGWGAAKIREFDAEMLAEYRRAWRTPEMIHGSCSDYRAAGTVDLEHDKADLDHKVGVRRSFSMARPEPWLVCSTFRRNGASAARM